MPFALKQKGGKYQVIDTETGEVKAASGSKSKAERALLVLQSLDKSWTEVQPGVYQKGQQTITITGGKK